jgi:hypothetical protein
MSWDGSCMLLCCVVLCCVCSCVVLCRVVLCRVVLCCVCSCVVLCRVVSCRVVLCCVVMCLLPKPTKACLRGGAKRPISIHSLSCTTHVPSWLILPRMTGGWNESAITPLRHNQTVVAFLITRPPLAFLGTSYGLNDATYVTPFIKSHAFGRD